MILCDNSVHFQWPTVQGDASKNCHPCIYGKYNHLIYLCPLLGSVVEVFDDDDGDFMGLLFQDHIMRTVYGSYPEVLLFDATYKLTDLRMPLYLLMAIDGNGHSEIVGVYLTVNETATSLRQMLAAFKRLNDSWERTSVIMTDKDMTERSVLAEVFPDATLQLCLFHTLRSFKREFSMEKMGLRAGMRDNVLDILAGMAHASSPTVFDEKYEMLKDLQLQPVVEFFNKNWLGIKHEWATCFKNDHFTLGELTNNRLESMNGKIKSVCSRFATLDTFFTEFFAVLRVLRGERTHGHIMQRIRTPGRPDDALTADDKRYIDHVTPYAFAQIRKQLVLRDSVKLAADGSGRFETSEGLIVATETSCHCSFAVTRKMPCRHIFAVRKGKGLSSFEPTLAAERWSAKVYDDSCKQKGVPCVGGAAANVQPRHVPRVLSSHQKFAAAMAVAKDLASLASDVGMVEYRERLAFLTDVRRSWAEGSSVRLTHTCEYDQTHTLSWYKYSTKCFLSLM